MVNQGAGVTLAEGNRSRRCRLFHSKIYLIRMKYLISLFSLLTFWIHLGAAEGYDLVIRGGHVIDGTGNPAYPADVGVTDGKVAMIGQISENGKVEIDASGRIVAPGFIDVHTHAENIERLPLAENFLRMGVTSAIIGNCGSSRLDLKSYFERLEGAGIAVNIASLIGHSTIRRKVIGPHDDRAPTEEELEEMREWVARAMQAGAVGLSTGLPYQPAVFAKTDEIVALAKVAAEFDGVYASHMRNEGYEVVSAVGELMTVAREAKIHGHISHIKVAGKSLWGQGEEILNLIESGREEGLSLTQDQYMYTAYSTHVRQLIPGWALEGGRERYTERIENPEEKERIVAEIKTNLERSGHRDFEYVAIASFRGQPELGGLRIPEAAAHVFGTDSVDAQIDLILDMERNGYASAIYHAMAEEDVRAFMRNPNTMFASDSGVRDPAATGMVHPRGHGNSARVLGHYVRGKEVLQLEEAIRRMTSLPAEIFNLKGRGQLQEGFAADIVVFDPEEVQDNATFEDPRQYATGFRYVLVNGEVVIEDDQHTGTLAGAVIRRGS